MNRERAKELPHLLNALPEFLFYDKITGDIVWLKSSGRAKKGNKAGYKTNQGRIMISVMGNEIFAHRIAWALHYGKFPKGIIDHIDGNPLNNTISNLRDVTQVENQRNSVISKHNSSGVNGVNWNREKQLWEAKITLNNKTRFIGRYKTKIAAAYARHCENMKNGFTNRHGSAVLITGE